MAGLGWDAIDGHGVRRLDELFAGDRDRAGRFSLEVAGIAFDWSKTHLDGELAGKFAAIAEAAGTNKMTLYRHFDSKDELVAEYLRGLAAEKHDFWSAIEASHPDDPRGQPGDEVGSFGFGRVHRHRPAPARGRV